MKAVRVLGYAINGRGMGHLTRQLAILRWVRRLAGAAGVKAEVWILTSSEADTLARREGVPSIKIPSKSMMRDAGLEPARYLSIARGWVLNAIATLQPDVLVVDTFPAGSFGELVSALELARHRVLVRRAMRPGMEKEVAMDTLLPLYDRVVVPDEERAPILLRERPELMSREAARVALGIPAGQRACWIGLGGGGDPTAAGVLPRLVDAVVGAGWHAVVGAGPLYVGPERRGPGVTWLDRYATMELLPGVDAAVSAGGYNSVHELRFVGVPTVFLPQEKLADDQLARARASGVVVGRPEEVAGALARATPPPPVERNGAREAAATVLSLVLDPADVRAAVQLWDDEALGALCGAGLSAERGLAMLRLFGGELPSAVGRRRAAAAELGVASPRAQAGAPVGRFVALCGGAVGAVLPVAEMLARRFPAATPTELLGALEVLLPVWARWGDWVGVLSLVRALPTQREYSITRFAPDFTRWVAGTDDPYEALRRFNTLEGGGARPVAEVLGMVG